MHNCTKIPPKKLAMGEWPSTSLKVTVIGATRQDTHDLPKFKEVIWRTTDPHWEYCECTRTHQYHSHIKFEMLRLYNALLRANLKKLKYDWATVL